MINVIIIHNIINNIILSILTIMICEENYDDYVKNIKKNKIERPLIIKSAIHDVGRFPFHTVDLSVIQRELHQYFNLQVPTTFKPIFCTTDKKVYDLEEKILKSELSIYQLVNQKYENIKLFTYQTFKDFLHLFKSLGSLKSSESSECLCVDQNKNMILTSRLGTIIKFGEVICIVLNKTHFIIRSLDQRKEFYQLGDHSLYQLYSQKNDNLGISGIYKSSCFTDYFVTTLENNENNKKINYISNFFNHKTNLSVITRTTYQDYIKETFTNKNGLRLYFRDDLSNHTRKIVSEYSERPKTGIDEDGDDEKTGLRFRGVYNAEMNTSNGKMIYKTLQKDNEYIYIKKGDDVLLNHVTEDIKKRDTEIIGWKVAQNEYGEKRIVKLAILPDANIVRPIDEEYFYTKGKERCNKAIVVDIQYPDEEKIESVVPHEMTAYSYLFNNQKFEYTVGKEVTPDAFDVDENVSCTNGIHYYRDRKSVFDVYVNR